MSRKKTDKKTTTPVKKRVVTKLFTAPGFTLSKASIALQEEKAAGGLIPHPYNLESVKDIHEPYHDRCLQLKAITTVGIGYEFLAAGSESPIEMTPPGNPDSTFDETLMKAAIDLESTGNLYLEPVRGGGGEIVELYWIPSDTVWLKERKEKVHGGYRQISGLQSVDFVPFGKYIAGQKGDKDIHELIHIRIPSAESRYYGVPDWIGAIGPVILSNNTTEYNARFFANNATPDWSLIISGAELDKDVEQSIKDFIETNLKGVENSRKLLYLNIPDSEVTIKWDQISGKVNDGDFLKLRAAVRDDIVSGHSVPPRLVGIVVAGQLGGGGEAKEQLKIFRETFSNPRKRLLETALNSTLFADAPGRIKFNEMSILDDETEEPLLPVAPQVPEEKQVAIFNILQHLKSLALHG